MLPKLEKEIERRNTVQCYIKIAQYLNENRFNAITKDLPEEYNYLRNYLDSCKKV